MVVHGFARVSYGFNRPPRWPVGILGRFRMVFLRFCNGFNRPPRRSVSFLVVFVWFSYGVALFSDSFARFSHGFNRSPRWAVGFLGRFRRVFLWFCKVFVWF